MIVLDPSAAGSVPSSTASAPQASTKADGLLELYAFLWALSRGTYTTQSGNAILNLDEQVSSREAIDPERFTARTLPRKLVLGFAATDQSGEKKGPHSDLAALKAIVQQQGFSMDDPMVIDVSADVSVEEGPSSRRGGKQSPPDDGNTAFANAGEGTPPRNELSSSKPKPTAAKNLSKDLTATAEDDASSESEDAVVRSNFARQDASATHLGFSGRANVGMPSMMEEEDLGEAVDSDVGIPIERD